MLGTLKTIRNFLSSEYPERGAAKPNAIATRSSRKNIFLIICILGVALHSIW